MWLAIDVDYRSDSANAAVVGFGSFSDEASSFEHIASFEAPAEYVPGRFFERELPCILAALRGVLDPSDDASDSAIDRAIDGVIVDGYAWLGPERPGLGAHLYAATGQRFPVIGVAKTAFHGAEAIEVQRPGSARPLYVTAAGLDPAEAARLIREMHGEHRIPTLLKRVDQLARGHS